MAEEYRMQSAYPVEGMEDVFIGLIGIKDDTDEIERQRKMAITLNVDWLIYLRELSEAVQLYKMIGCSSRFIQLKEWHYSILAFLFRQEHKGFADDLRALSTPFASRATYKTKDGKILGDFPLSSVSDSFIKKASEHLNKRLGEVELDTRSSIYNAIKEENRDRKSDCPVKTDVSTCSLNGEEQDKTVSRPGSDFTLFIDDTHLL